MWGKKQQLKTCMEILIGSELRKKYNRDVCSHPAYLTYMLHHEKFQAGWIISWSQDRQEKYQQPKICGWYHSSGRKQRGTKEPLDEGEEGEWKSQLKI